MSSSARRHIAIALLHDVAARDFLDSGVLGELKQQFRISFVVSSRLTLDLSQIGPTICEYAISPMRLRGYLFASALDHLVRKSPFDLGYRHTFGAATFGYGPAVRNAVLVFSRLGLARVVSMVGRWLLRMSAPKIFTRTDMPDILLIYTSVRSYFADDLVRAARMVDLPMLAITNNWDNINTKVFYEQPDYIGVWGQQGYLVARLMHCIEAYRIFVIGAPRYEVYRNHMVSRSEAREKLSLPDDKRIMLFCGAGVAFEETSLLAEIEQAIETGILPRDLHIVYKPHPIRFKRESEEPFDQAAFSHISLAPQSTRHLTELTYYPALFAAVDAVISPFSSMVMEGARHGLPALCLGYNSDGHANHDWDRAAFNLHLSAIRLSDWAVICEAREEFLGGLEKLVFIMGREDIAEYARASAEFVWKTGFQSVAERISNAVDRILSGRHADNSLHAYETATGKVNAVAESEFTMMKEQ